MSSKPPICLVPSFLLWLGVFCLAATGQESTSQAAAEGTRVFNVRDFGAKGDGRTRDTQSIQQAIAACAQAGGGQVVFPAGRYLSGTVRLTSNMTLRLEADARLVGSSDLADYQHFLPPAGSFEARSPKWHRALVLGDGVQNVTITGPGVIDGNKVFDAQGEERMRGPHTILLGRSKHVTLHDLTVVDSANYAVMLEWSHTVDVRNVTITGGWDGVHFRASRDEPCQDIRITGCQFYTGDDSIAGRYVDNLLVEDCVINSSCNGVRIIGPMRHMIVRNCRFFGEGHSPHRTSNRRNMLAGIILQPGAWDPAEGALEDVSISDIQMTRVASPITIWLKRPGNTADRITVSRLTASGVYRAAASVESWTDTPIGRVTFRDVDVQYEGGGKRPPGGTEQPKPGLDAQSLAAWGFYARNVESLHIENARWHLANSDQRPALWLERIGRVSLANVQFPHVADAEKAVVARDIRQVDVHDSDVTGIVKGSL